MISLWGSEYGGLVGLCSLKYFSAINCKDKSDYFFMPILSNWSLPNIFIDGGI